MTVKHIAVIVKDGRFEVQTIDEWKCCQVVAGSHELGECLKRAEAELGHPLVIPLSGPTTVL